MYKNHYSTDAPLNSDRPIIRIREKLSGVKPTTNGYDARCPAHADARASLSVAEGDDGRVLLKCHAGCDQEKIVAAIGLTMADLFARPERSGTRKIVKTYDYTDEHGKIEFQVTRYDPKEFRQRRPDPNGGWIYNLKGVRHLPYRLPELLADKGSVFIVEGEKDVETLRDHGLIATCNAGGAGKWREEFGLWLKARVCILIADNDEAGRKHTEDVTKKLGPYALKVINLGALPDTCEHGDVSDWFKAGHKASNLLALVDNAEAIKPPSDTLQAPQVRSEQQNNAHIFEAPTVDVSDLTDLACAHEIGWKIIGDTFEKVPPFIFQGPLGRSVQLFDPDINVNNNRRGAPFQLREMTIDRLRQHLSWMARFVTHDKNGAEKATKVPVDMVQMLLASDRPRLQPLRRIVEIPAFAEDGTLETNLGYRPKSKTYCDPFLAKYPPIDIPDVPTNAHVRGSHELTQYVSENKYEAVIQIGALTFIDELLDGFPFKDLSSKAHAIGLLLLPFCRDLMDGPVPLHMIAAPQAGTGKTSLAQALLAPAFGKIAGTPAPSEDEEEWTKLITSVVKNGASYLFLDNARSLTSSTLCGAVTSIIWKARELGHNRTIEAPMRLVWLATANNPAYDVEIARRVITIGLDAKVEQPWTRDKFKHPDLLGWATERRSHLIRSALVLIQNWIAKGRPKPAAKPLGSFEAWSNVIGGILEAAGITGFLGNLSEHYELADTETEAWREFVEQWNKGHGSQWVKTAPLLRIAEDIEGFPLGTGDTEKSKQTVFGSSLMRKTDVVFGDYQIKRRKERPTAYKLECLNRNREAASV